MAGLTCLFIWWVMALFNGYGEVLLQIFSWANSLPTFLMVLPLVQLFLLGGNKEERLP